MSESDKAAYTLKDILRMEVAPALGCTEPAAVALAAATAAVLLDRQFDALELWLDPNTYKNGVASEYITGTDEEEMLRAIALSHIITAYVKAHTGRLSAVCGCSIAAGAGATSGVAYLMGGIVATTPEQTMKNVSQLSAQGMIEADRTILQIMIDKQL